jgi:hypothetical protein
VKSHNRGETRYEFLREQGVNQQRRSGFERDKEGDEKGNDPQGQELWITTEFVSDEDGNS